MKQQKIISRSTGNWSPSGVTKQTKGCHGHFDWLHLKTLSIKNGYYDRKK